MQIIFNSRKIEVPDVKLCSNMAKVKGLMFSKPENAEALLFQFDKDSKMKIHSFFVFFPFFAVWLDKDNNILGIKKVNPFTPGVWFSKSYRKLLEIPVNSKYGELLRILDENEKFKYRYD